LLKWIPRTAIPISLEEIATIVKKICTGEVIEGNDIETFERNFVNYLGCKHAVSVNKGRTALTVSLEALNLKPGDEVIAPAFTCPIIFEAVLRSKLKLVLVDVNSGTFNIDLELMEKAVSSKSKVVIPVHMFGQPCDIEAIVEIANQHGLYVIEDVAQALGAKYMERKVGIFGDLSFFSFGPGKNITCGEGGIIGINNEEVVEKTFEMRSELPKPDMKDVLSIVKNIFAMYMFSSPYLYGLVMERVREKTEKEDNMTTQNLVRLVGGQQGVLYPTMQLKRMSNVSAAIASIQLKKVDEMNQKRVDNAKTYTSQLNNFAEICNCKLPEKGSSVESVFTRYVIKAPKKKRDFLADQLIRHGIDVERPYHFLSRILDSFGHFSRAEQLCKTLITLPNQPSLSASELSWILGVFEKISGEGFSG